MYICDDICNIFLDGQLLDPGIWPNLKTYNVTLSEGYHWLAASLYNGGTAAGASKIAIAMVKSSDSTLITQTTASWNAASFWDPNFYEHYSFDSTFVSNPPSYDCACDSPGTTNIASNPKLATSIGSWYVSFTGSSTGTDTRQTSGGPAGIASAYFRRTLNAIQSGSAFSISMNSTGSAAIPVVGGQTYTVSGYARSSYAGLAYVQMRLREFDVAGNQIGSGTNGSQVTFVPNTWQRGSVTLTLDPKTVYLQERMYFSGSTNAPSGTTYDATGVMYTSGATLFNYADGDSTGWSWLGTANSSPSSGPAL